MSKQDRNARYYAANKEKRTALNQEIRARDYAYVNAIKHNAECLDCKVRHPYYVMDFDHIGTDKLYNVSDMCRNMFSIAKIQEEIDKCEIVCSNCHRERTHNRRLGVLTSPLA